MPSADDDRYESQNEQRLDDLHAKIRTLRGVTTDIHDDVERQNLMLDDSANTFASFGSSLATTSRQAARAFGIGQGSVRQTRIIVWIVGGIVGLFVLWKLVAWWFDW